jgi:predicted Rossmann-fold nucleotide-binding protein
MGAVAEAAQAAGANVTAVTIEKYAHEPQLGGVKIIPVKTEAARFNSFLAEQPVALFVLPGGPGSLREAMQGLENAIYENGPPVILVKVGQYLKGIKQYFNQAVLGGMVKAEKKDCLKVWTVGTPLKNVVQGSPAATSPPPTPKNP